MIGEIISYEAFAQLRLADLVAPHFTVEPPISARANWEYMGGYWIGEAIGFTDFLRLETMPDELGAVSLTLTELPDEFTRIVLDRLRLPIAPRMRKRQVDAALGRPIKTSVFVQDRKSFDYNVGTRWPYQVGCTIHNRRGLSYLTVIRTDVLARCKP